MPLKVIQYHNTVQLFRCSAFGYKLLNRMTNLKLSLTYLLHFKNGSTLDNRSCVKDSIGQVQTTSIALTHCAQCTFCTGITILTGNVRV
jgi:hypothetical protein